MSVAMKRAGVVVRRLDVVSLVPHILGLTREVALVGIGGGESILAGVVEKPADVGVVKAAHSRTVRIAVAIGEPVVVDVMPRPPERSLLHRRGADERPHEAHGAIHLERTVREIAMKCERQADRAEEM